MTTTINLVTHAWPVEVTTIDQYGDRDATETRETVPPGAARSYYLTNSRSLVLKELPAPATADVPTQEAEPVSDQAEPPVYTA